MADDFETTQEARAAPETTVIHEVRSGGGGAGWAIAVILMIALVAGAWLFSQSNSSQAAKNNAVANAADNVGQAARDVGNAAKDAADNTTKP